MVSDWGLRALPSGFGVGKARSDGSGWCLMVVSALCLQAFPRAFLRAFPVVLISFSFHLHLSNPFSNFVNRMAAGLFSLDWRLF